jgi:hypothetical protein
VNCEHEEAGGDSLVFHEQDALHLVGKIAAATSVNAASATALRRVTIPNMTAARARFQA